MQTSSGQCPANAWQRKYKDTARGPVSAGGRQPVTVGHSPPSRSGRAAAAAAVLRTTADRAYDVLLVDPPYATPDAEVAGWLAAAHAHGWLGADALVVVERGRGGAFPWPPPLLALRERRYGDTVLHTGRVASAA